LDIVSAVFATYLDAVSNTVHDRFRDSMNTEVTAKIVSYQDYQISYSHQLWKIQDKSVCETYSEDLNQKSLCSQAAKNMFRDMCHYLQNKPQSGSKFKSTKNMYCNAATNFKPLIATVSFNEKSENQKSKQACSVAILKAMDEPTDSNIQARKKACSQND
jgi:hypothetical protein